ncbi:MAG: radical SAM protein [Acidobacteria bacterium]|nr:radical SAM protein [Acidobacteriota bacterium]
MRVLLISGNREDVDIRVPALGMACVSAAAGNAGHQVSLLDLLIERDAHSAILQAISDFRPEVIGISVRNIDDQSMRDTRFLLDQAREAVECCREASSAPLILGGAGFSILPQPILEYLGADMGIQGEGEAVFPELLRRLQESKNLDTLPGLYLKNKSASVRRSFCRDLDAFPLPDPALLARSLSGAANAPVPVQTRRGCPMSCSYCSTPTIEGRSVRWRSPESIVAWMKRWVDEGFRHFYFVDNTFNLPPSYATQLCSQIITAGLDISWRCILYPGGLSPKLIEMMAGAGCREVSMGFESGAESMLRNMHKQFDTQEVRRTSEMLRLNGIRRMGFLLLGGPGENRDSVEESLAFAESLELDSLRLSLGIRIYPGTEIARLAMEEGLISSEQDLLYPRFYLARGLEDWLYDTVARRVAGRPNCIL